MYKDVRVITDVRVGGVVRCETRMHWAIEVCMPYGQRTKEEGV